MRKILTLFVFFFLTSCSGPTLSWNDPIDIGDKTFFNPPSWIQGVWINEGNSYYNMEFTNNNFLIRGVSYNERINSLSTEFLSSKEVVTSGKYKVTITHLTDNITVYNFTFVSDDEILCNYDAIDWGERTVEVFTLKRQ